MPLPDTWRPLTPADLDDIVALTSRWEEHHQLPFRGDADEIRHDLNDPKAHLAERTIGAWADGVLLGFGWVYRRPAGQGATKHRAVVYPLADPDHDDLEAVLLDWCDDVASSLLPDLGDGLDRVLRGWSPQKISARIARFQARGYRVARLFSTLTRPVAGAAVARPPADVAIVDWDDEQYGRRVFDAHVEAFGDHWGSVPPDWHTWRSDYVGDPHSRLDLSTLAVAGDEVVGYTLNQVWPEDAAARGLTEGYIGALGVRPAWRKRGIASALLLESIRRFADAGFDNATLTADADNTTGAFELYTRLGFTVVDSDVTLVREI